VVLDEAARRHREEYARSEQQELFDRLRKLHSAEETNPTYTILAEEMGVPLGTLKSLVNRFRRRYREHIRAVIAETVADSSEVEDEIRHLLQIFAR
jgi:DNA-directed RNA polymerase specialized sigma24 family protein